mmetsp:Transcript_7117/g.24663  ORF Transcript_7117/g.24663 Transcript_7117/m.24663 type:complete len:213 (+) Transcript_7117:362-1000(+)
MGERNFGGSPRVLPPATALENPIASADCCRSSVASPPDSEGEVPLDDAEGDPPSRSSLDDTSCPSGDLRGGTLSRRLTSASPPPPGPRRESPLGGILPRRFAASTGPWGGLVWGEVSPVAAREMRASNSSTSAAFSMLAPLSPAAACGPPRSRGPGVVMYSLLRLLTERICSSLSSVPGAASGFPSESPAIPVGYRGGEEGDCLRRASSPPA